MQKIEPISPPADQVIVLERILHEHGSSLRQSDKNALIDYIARVKTRCEISE